MKMPAAFRRPVRRRVPRIELDTPIVPRAVAEGVWEEAGVWLGQPLPRREMAAQTFHHVYLAVLERHDPVWRAGFNGSRSTAGQSARSPAPPCAGPCASLFSPSRQSVIQPVSRP